MVSSFNVNSVARFFDTNGTKLPGFEDKKDSRRLVISDDTLRNAAHYGTGQDKEMAQLLLQHLQRTGKDELSFREIKDLSKRDGNSTDLSRFDVLG